MNKKKTIFKCNKKGAAAAILATAAMLIITGLAVMEEGTIFSYLMFAVLLSILGGVFVLLDLSFGKIVSAIFYLLIPFAALWALENYTHVLSDLTLPILLLNAAFQYLLYGLCVFLFGSVKWGFGIATLVPMIYGLANYYVVNFRGTPIVPWDFLSIGTAMSVAGNYTFTLSWKAALSVIAFIWMILLASKSTVKFRSWKVRTAAGLVYLILLGGYVFGIQTGSVQSYFGLDTTLFTLNVMYRNNGIAGAFLRNLQYLNLEKPEGYSLQAVEGLVDAAEQKAAEAESAENEADKTIQSETEQAGNDAGSEIVQSDNRENSSAAKRTGKEISDEMQHPNIIVVMNEAFSDLSVWGELSTSEEVMPFFKQLQQEGIGGELYVSVKGGNTANTEFEFLTGDTMAFLPAGSVPYQQYLNEETPSIASYLKKLGYYTLAIHPYNRSGWDRDQVYEYFGFDEFLDKNAFDNPYRMRGYISDSSAFDKIVEQYEIKPDGQPMFVFEVTMQNHGGYSTESPDFTTYLKLENITSRTTSVAATEKYLTLMNQTDRALEEMIQYFEEQDEPVVVLMFGDHQPSDYITNAVQRILGISVGDSLEEIQNGYRVPFMIWSNQGLEPEYYDGISVNYLGGILMEAAGIPLTGYQEFLSTLMKTLPVTSGLVYRDSEGIFYSYGDEAYSDILKEYNILQYNHLVDTDHRVDAFFGS